MATDALDAVRSANYEIAEAIAPTWERRRADVETVSRHASCVVVLKTPASLE